MDNVRKNLNIYFKEVDPWMIIKNYYKGESDSFEGNIETKEYIKIAQNDLWIRSEDEVENIYQYSKIQMQDKDASLSKNYDFKSIFNLLCDFGSRTLIEKNGHPIVLYEHLLRWKETTHQMGQDIFTCAFLASQDSITGVNRYDFSWKPIIETNNNRLENILSKGMAENHFHLKGSSSTYLLSWVSLMNRVIGRRKEFEEANMIDGLLNRSLDLRIDRNKSNLYYLVSKASMIRLFLFKLLKGELDLSKEERQDNKSSDNRKIDRRLKDIIYNDDIEINLDFIQREINNLKFEYGYRGNFSHVIDYCIPKNILETIKMNNIFMIGEREFLYSVLKRIYNKDRLFLKYGNLFYAYLLIKEKFRSELIQVNNKSGFRNFSNYQDRKMVFLENEKELKSGVISIALNSTLENQNIKSLEARIVPRDSFYGIESQIKEIDDIAIRGINRNIEEVFDNLNKEDNSQDILDKYFYNLHFVKWKDRFNKKNEMSNYFYERDYSRRTSLKKEAHAIIKSRNLNTNASSRIYGIDACANEIGCRPEVFAQAFRFIRTYANKKEFDRLKSKKEIPVLGATYHAGEDFIDIIDGLRAIDEVIKFLGFTHGDRIGHALVLGIDVRDWAEYKERNIVISKQDYLDNIVWFICKMKKFNIYDKNLEYWLEKEFYRIFDEIYIQGVDQIKTMETELRGITSTEYYWAWKLRGDNPRLYETGKYKDIVNLSYWDSCSKNINKVKDGESFRRNDKISYLYHLYHFNGKVKENGAKMKEYKITEELINAMIVVQRGMREYVRNKGIGIETNPSSNVLIGTFRKYNKHPIMNFYNLDLTLDSEEIKKCPQIFVSINTDDQGVFDTYLENEYALLSLALEKEKNSDGSSKYNQAMIYRWLDNIRQMGLEQSFKKIKYKD